MATKKVWSTGRYGARYGKKIKRRVIDIERKQKIKHKCPRCDNLAVKRLFSGVWQCKKCNAKLTGRAYEP